MAELESRLDEKGLIEPWIAHNITLMQVWCGWVGFSMVLSFQESIFWIVLLSLADLVFTLIGLDKGVITEANPLMGAILTHSSILFIAAKVGLTFMFLLIMGIFGNRVSWARYPLHLILGIYLVITALHIRWMLLTL